MREGPEGLECVGREARMVFDSKGKGRIEERVPSVVRFGGHANRLVETLVASAWRERNRAWA